MNLTNYAITKKTNPDISDLQLKAILSTVDQIIIRTEGESFHAESIEVEGRGNKYFFASYVTIQTTYKDGPGGFYGEEPQPRERVGKPDFWFSNTVAYNEDGEQMDLTGPQVLLIENALEAKIFIEN